MDPWFLANRDQPDVADTSTQLLAQLAAAGFPPDRVDFVVNSHIDGVGWNTVPDGDGWELAFPNATYLYPAEDVDAVADGVPFVGVDDFVQLTSLTDVVPVV